MSDRTALVAELAARLGPGDACERLAAYVELLERWSATHNLVSFASRRELLDRHVLEPLPLVASLPGRGLLLDVGSGAGLPGVPLLVLCPGWRGVLLEPRHKRWAFLRLVVRELGLAATVVARRYQDLEVEEPFDLVTARAVGRHPELVAWARGQLRVGGRVALWVGAEDARDLAALPGWRVLSCAVAGPERGRLVQLEPCFT